jgi:hypothetical protein
VSVFLVMPANAGIHVFLSGKDVDGRDKPGHDAENVRRVRKAKRAHRSGALNFLIRVNPETDL